MIEYPTRSELSEIFNYDRETGILSGKETRGNRKAGKPVGHKCTTGYLQVRLLGKNLSVARICWIIAVGTLPDQIDHINRDKTDNRLCNLRESCQTRNQRNKATQKNNTSGKKGVSFDRQSGLWKVRIGAGNKRVTIGMFKHFALAVAAREGAEKALGYHPS